MSIPDLCQWLQDTPWGVGIRESTWLFPIIEGTHTIGIALSVGDPAHCGSTPGGRPDAPRACFPGFESTDALEPGRLRVMFITGALLFWSQAMKAYGSIFFRIKLALLVLAASTRWYSS
jgi:hypothetical protein